MLEAIKHFFDIAACLFTLDLVCRLLGALRDVYLARALVRSGAAPDQINHAIDVFSSRSGSTSSSHILHLIDAVGLGKPSAGSVPNTGRKPSEHACSKKTMVVLDVAEQLGEGDLDRDGGDPI